MTVWLIEDDAGIADALRDFLGGRGCGVALFGTLAAARRALTGARPDVILLDWNLPDGEGAAFCRELRAQDAQLPVLLLTVRSDTADMLAGFGCGADDYVTKPFDRELLYARLQALWRRSQAGGGADSPLKQCGGILLDEARQTVACNGQAVELAPLEYRLLAILMRNRGRTVTRAQLLDALWDQSGRFVNDNTLTVTMKRLREKLGQPACLKTVRSFGYRMEEDEP